MGVHIGGGGGGGGGGLDPDPQQSPIDPLDGFITSYDCGTPCSKNNCVFKYESS